MTQKYRADGTVVPVTKILAGPCTITQVKTNEQDHYQSVQVGFGQAKKINRPLSGHLKGLANFKYLREFRIDDLSGFQKGQSFTVTSFKPGDKIEVIGYAKGKGFQGVVKRHHFHGSPASHGHKDQLRHSGSIGAGGVQNVFKNLRMAGRMGNQRVTVKNLEVIEVDEASSSLFIKGAVPGARHGLVIIKGEGELARQEPLVGNHSPAAPAVAKTGADQTPPAKSAEADAPKTENETSDKETKIQAPS